ncbi:predicted protein [Lichtheimia corymbifera JMRC:FSU:9682]|uniref:Uncharacterized protein n=1 Tax=Lichtheimia corymbifera JMRC:FSU:9682 TaxID=1263082 RepID=A0A068RF42_9FUNG|nr:predicted protein [Lichtheimia corymbifera JMRC:FSU:9682]
MTKKGLTNSRMEREHASIDHMAVFNQHGGFDGWMQSSAVMRYCFDYLARRHQERSRGYGEDADGLDVIDEMDYTLTKGALQPWVLLEYSSQCMQQLFRNRGWRMFMTAAAKNTVT